MVSIDAAPDMSGLWVWIFVKLLEMPLIGSVILTYLKKQNKIQEVNFFFKTFWKVDIDYGIVFVSNFKVAGDLESGFVVFMYVMQMLRETVIPEPPMFRPEFPPQGFISPNMHLLIDS